MEHSTPASQEIIDSVFVHPEHPFRNIDPDVDEYELPFESLTEFSDDPLGFEEMAEELWQSGRLLYLHTKKFNRYSPLYDSSCAYLEKIIRKLASLCVTKAVLEQNGFTFPSLEAMTVEELYRMVSFHFRKTSAALEGMKEEKNQLDSGYLAWLYRWFTLAERLKLTEEKIQNIRDGKIKSESILKCAQFFQGTAKSEKPAAKRNADPAAAGKECAFPVMGSFARQLVQEKKSKEQKTAAFKRELERENPPYPPMRLSDDIMKSPLRQELMRMAKSLGDTQGMKAIMVESTESAVERYERYLDELESPPHLQKGPSDDTRRRLRDQRKKKKKK